MNPPSEAELKRLATLVGVRCGIRLSGAKKDYVSRRLGRRLLYWKHESLSEYLDMLAHNPEELQVCLNELTTNLTAFFREPHHFETLANALPTVASPPRILCAGCSTGEEAYSIAIVCLESRRPDSRILAGDVNSDVLSIASRGIYPTSQVEELGTGRRAFFLKGTGPNDGRARIKERVRSLISFLPFNLSDFPEPQEKFHVIFCRNVLIYFKNDTRKKILARFADMLETNGLLFLGHSESCHEFPSPYQLIARTTFRRKP